MDENVKNVKYSQRMNAYISILMGAHKHFVSIAGYIIHQSFKILVVSCCMSILCPQSRIFITQVLKHSEKVEKTCIENLVGYQLLRD